MPFNLYPDHPTSTSLGTPLDTPVPIKKGQQFPGGKFVSLAGNAGPDPSFFNLATTFLRISMSAPLSATPPQVELQAVTTSSGTGPSVVIDPTVAAPGVSLLDGANPATEAASAYFFGPFANNVYLLKVVISIPGTTLNMRLTNNLPDDHDFVWVVSSNDDPAQPDSAQQPWVQLTPFSPFSALVNQTAAATAQALQINNRGTGTLTITKFNPALAAPYELNPSGVMNAGLPATILPNPATPASVLIGFDAPATNAATPVTNLTVDGDAQAVSGAGHNNAFTLSATTTALEIVMLLDTSSSMLTMDTSTAGQTRLSELQSAASQFLNYLALFAAGTGNTIGVAQFPGSDPNNPSTFDVIRSEAIPANMTAATTKINALVATDSTPMDNGLVEVLTTGYFSNNTSNNRWMLLMSDGAWNVGNDPRTELSKLVAGKIVVYAAGFGQTNQVDYATLKALSTDPGTTPGGQAYQIDLGPAVPGKTSAVVLAEKFKSAIAKGLTLNAASDPVGAISRGEENDYQIIITPYDRKASFSLNWQTPNAGLILELLTPTGDRITPDSAAQTPGVTFVSDPRYQMYGIDESYLESRAGSWRLIVSFPSYIGVAAASYSVSEPYSYSVLTDSSLKLRVDLDRSTYFAGDTIGVTATVTAGGLPVTDATVQLSVTAPAQSMDDWLAGIPITAAEYASAAQQLAGQDVWPVYIKTFAAQLKGLTYNSAPNQTILAMTPTAQSGAYVASVSQTTIPDGHTLYVTVTGTTPDGIVFRREASVDVHIGVKPTAEATLFNLTYGQQTNPKLITGVVSVTPLDALGHRTLVDPGTSQFVQLQAQGATLDPKLATTFNGTYTSNVTYPAGTSPTFTLIVGGQTLFTNQGIVPVDKFVWVDEVVSFTIGAGAAPGVNQHIDPNDALGDIRTRPANTFVSLGAYGALAVAVNGQQIDAQGDDDITVFSESTIDLRSYVVEALPVGADAGSSAWVSLGNSPGGTASFGLQKGGLAAAGAIRITDTSGRTRDSGFNPLPDPGVGVIAVGVKSVSAVGGGGAGGGGSDKDVCIRIRVLNPAGQPLGGTVDLQFQPQDGGETTSVNGVDASSDIDVKGLARYPQVDVYEVTVTPTDVFKPTSQFLTIPASGFNSVVFTIQE